MPLLKFKYMSDKQYFADKFANGSLLDLEEKFYDLFDFRDLAVKRAEFKSLRGKVFQTIFDRADGLCEICGKASGTTIDHKVPLGSNEFNKKIRKMPLTTLVNGKRLKAPRVSYGSNHMSNLQLACKSCNRKKWHLP